MRLALPPRSCMVYTTVDLATAVVRAVGDTPSATWLEPSHGKGVFVRVAADLGVAKERIVAIDLDRTPSDADKLAETLRGVDFLRWAKTSDRRFDRIVGNPPFISIERLPSSLQRSAASTVRFDGEPIGRGANLWYAFTVAAARLLNEGGCLAFVLPSAAEFADYSADMRRVVGEKFKTLELYRCRQPLFDNVQEGTLVAVARGYGSHRCLVRRRLFETREALIEGLAKSGRVNGHKCPRGLRRQEVASCTFGSIAKIRLGGVTGDAAYFLMNEKKRRELNLPLCAVQKVVTKARHLRSGTFNNSDWHDLKSCGERIWLFNPRGRAPVHPKVKAYLRDGGCRRQAFKVSIRGKTWYRTPMPKTPDAFISGMTKHGPWICINESAGINATNTLYVVTFESRNRQDWYKWALSLLSSPARRQVRRLGRRYADGLIKFEPGCLGKIRLPALQTNTDHKLLYLKAINEWLAGHFGDATKIADSALASAPSIIHAPYGA
jgi:adenine-specific DNA-methyltransferase